VPGSSVAAFAREELAFEVALRAIQCGKGTQNAVEVE
jgi:hypothetical protein